MELDLHEQINKRKGWQKVILLTIQGYFDNKVGRNAAAKKKPLGGLSVSCGI